MSMSSLCLCVLTVGLFLLLCVNGDYVSVHIHPVSATLHNTSFFPNNDNGSTIIQAAYIGKQIKLHCNQISNMSSINMNMHISFNNNLSYCEIYSGVQRFLNEAELAMVITPQHKNTLILDTFQLDEAVDNSTNHCQKSTPIFKVQRCPPTRYIIKTHKGSTATVDIWIRYNKRLSIATFLLAVLGLLLIGTTIALIDWKRTGTRGRSELTLVFDILGNIIYFTLGGFLVYLTALGVCGCWYLSCVGKEFAQEFFYKTIMWLVPFGRKCEVHSMSHRYIQQRNVWIFTGGLVIIAVEIAVVVINCISVIGLSVVNKHLELLSFAFNPFKGRIVLSSDEVLSSIISPRSAGQKDSQNPVPTAERYAAN